MTFMRILHIADLHYKLDWYTWVTSQSDNYDLLVIAGDLLNTLPCEDTPLPQQARVASEWLRQLPKPTVVCSGNHDAWSRNADATTDAGADGGWLMSCQRDGLIVDGQSMQYGGEKIASVKWLQSDWPLGTSTLVTHAPPAHTRVSVDASGIDFGDAVIARRIIEKHPQFVLSGHVHTAADWIDIVGGSYCFNPGCDWMALAPNHIYIDTTARIARWHTAMKGCVEKRLDGCHINAG